MSNPESLNQEKAVEQAKIREVQERIRLEVSLQVLDVETITRINEIIVEEAGKYKKDIKTSLHYDIAFPFVRDEVMRRLKDRDDRDDLLMILGDTHSGGEQEKIQAQLDYIEKYGDAAFRSLLGELTRILDELVVTNRQATDLLWKKLKARGFTDNDLNTLETDGTSNVIVAWHARCETPRLLYDRGKSPKEILAKKLYAKAA